MKLAATLPLLFVVAGAPTRLEPAIPYFTNLRQVQIAEPDRQLLSQAAGRYGFGQELLFTDLEDMLAKVRPQAVLGYTSTYDHRKVVELCARYAIPVMMEKPLATTYDDGQAIARAARAAGAPGEAQARAVLESTTGPKEGFAAAHAVAFELYYFAG